jgi:Na+/proline symporter
MKNGLKLGLLGLFLAGAFAVSAQTNNSHPWISKDVQKISNKKMLADYKASQLKATSVGYPAVVLSKGVHKISASTEIGTQGNMASKGYPYWTVSKGVQRIGRK